jgi:Glycosyl transferases group 1/Glycosyltransferase Family 4
MAKERGAEIAMSAVESGQRKKLLYLAVCDPDLEVTGATVRMGAFVRHLGRFYDITLVNMTGSGYRVNPEIEEQCRDRENRLGVTQRVQVQFSQAGYFLFSPTLFRRANRLLQSGSFATLLVDYGLAAIYGRFFAGRYSIPMVYSSHNVEYQKYREQMKTDFRRGLLAPYVYWAERAACRAAKLVVAISESDRREYAKWIAPNKIEVAPQGFDPDVCNPFYPPPPISPPVVLFVGNFRLEHNREAARLIVKEILPEVIRARPDVKFQLVGAEPPVDLTGPNMEYTGFVDDLGPYLRRANLVIAPMPFGFGMSTKIVSALAFGKTVLTTPQGAGAISRKYRQLVVSSLDGFASRIVDLLATRPPVDVQDFATVCDEFAWPSITARLYRRIEECCSPDGMLIARRKAEAMEGLRWQ